MKYVEKLKHSLSLNSAFLVVILFFSPFIGVVGFYEFETRNPTAQATSGNPTAYAILIGISDYPSTYNDLEYCHEDMKSIRSLLINDLGYSTDNIFSFFDSQATSTNILAKLSELKDIMTSDDTLFFYYSGHGDHGYTSGGETSLTIESAHDYADNFEYTWTINHPGADGIRVHFSKIRLEDGYDYIFIGDENLYIDLNDLDNSVFEDYYTGSWDANDPYSWSYWVYSDTLKIKMITDESNTDWGFKADKYEIMNWNYSAELSTYDSLSGGSGIWGSTLDAYFDQLPCAEIYTVVDACYSGGMRYDLDESDRVVLSAAEFSRSSLEDSGREHGLFTYYFLQAFERSGVTSSYSGSVDTNGNGNLEWNEINAYVTPNTLSRSTALGYAHEPEFVNNLANPNTIMRPLVNEVEQTPFNNGYFSMNYTIYGSNSINYINYTLSVSDNSNITGSIAGPEIDFGEYEITYTPSGSEGIDAYYVLVNFSSGMSLLLFDSAISTDSDSDNIPDTIEELLGTAISDTDSDSDNLNDFQELMVYGTDPLDPDTDNDGIEDREEVITSGTSPFDPDCDNDGLEDGMEFYTHNSDPFATDSDLDGYSDVEEIDAGTDPSDPNSHPNSIDWLLIVVIILVIVVVAAIVGFILMKLL